MNLKEPQKQLDLEEFLSKCSALERLLDSSQKLSRESRVNIEWYCNYRIGQYYERYLSYFKWKEEIDKKYSIGAK
jgi:hypothetical protein